MKTKFAILFTVIFLLCFAEDDLLADNLARPNIVLIVADYMGYGDIGSYGATDIQTPSLDKLASAGIQFSDYYSASPICGPSRAALLSGYYPARVGLENNISGNGSGLHASDNNLLKGLKSKGYKTAMIGKWHLGNEPGLSPLSHGFDQFFGFHSWTLGYHSHKTSSGEPGLYRGDEIVEEPGYLTDLFTKEAIQVIEDTPDNPFFLYLAFNTGLPPYQRPDMPKSRWSEGWDVNSASREDYVAMVESMDQGIGRILSTLEERNLVDNTLVVFTYDHGGRHLVRSEPLYHGFRTLWEGGIRVPLIIRWPDEIKHRNPVARPTIAMDLTATLLHAAGNDPGVMKLDGYSVLPLLASGTDVTAETLFWRYSASNRSMKAVRKGNWKYVLDGHTQFLFDLSSDIGERVNQFNAHPGKVNELRIALATWEEELEND